MDELVYNFIKTYLPIEVQELIEESYILFEKFDYKDVDDSLINIISSEDFTDPGELQDVFILEFNSKIDYVISQNGLTLKSDTSLHDKVEIMRSLYQLQHLENYNILYNLISSQDNDDETKLCSVLAENCSLDTTSILYILSNIDHGLINKLRQYIEMKLDKEINEVCSDSIIENIKCFYKFLHTKNRTCLGTQLISSRVELGLEFSYYFPHVEDHILSMDDEQTALNFLSVIMISKDGQNKVTEIYREYISKLLDSVNQVQKIEKILNTHYQSFIEYKQKSNIKI